MSTLACIKRDDQTDEQQNEVSPISEGQRKRRRAFVTVWYLIKASFMNDYVLIKGDMPGFKSNTPFDC